MVAAGIANTSLADVAQASNRDRAGDNKRPSEDCLCIRDHDPIRQRALGPYVGGSFCWLAAIHLALTPTRISESLRPLNAGMARVHSQAIVADSDGSD